MLRDFWRDFIGAVDSIKDVRVREVLDVLDAILAPHLFPPSEDGTDPRVCPTCGTGRLGLKLGRFGAFIGCSNYPECRYTRQLAANGAASADKVLGKDPETGLEVAIKTGRFGTYLQLGEASKDKEEKPKRAGIPKGMVGRRDHAAKARSSCSRCRAKSARIRRTASRSWPASAASALTCSTARPTRTSTSSEDVLTIGLNRAVTLIAEKRANPGKGRRFGADPGRSLGDHPQRGGPILVKKGRYGPYVTNNGINATIPDDKTPEEITLEEAVALIEARAEKTGAKPAPRRKGRARRCAASPSPRRRRRTKAAKPEEEGRAKPPRKKAMTAAE